MNEGMPPGQGRTTTTTEHKRKPAPSAGKPPQGKKAGGKGAGASAGKAAGASPGKASGKHAKEGSQKGNGGAPGRKKARFSARELALEALVRVEKEGAYSNLLLNRLLDEHPLERADAGLATELVYGTIQRQGTLDYFLAPFVTKGVDKLQPWVRCLFRASVYQLVYLDRIPDHAIVNEAVTIAKKRGHAGLAGLVNAVLRRMLRERDKLTLPEGLPAAESIALEHSHPLWLVRRWVDRYGADDAASMCAANNRPPKLSVRANIMRGGRDAALARLRESGVQAEASALAPDGIVATGAGNLALSPLYRDGDITVQDESSMLVARLVAPQPGQRVLDCCAAPGGKTTHLAELMGNKGEVWASDLHAHKEALIAEQAARLGLTCIRTLTADARELAGKFAPASFDRLLLDAPCSGLGVIRRKPDIKWTKREEDIKAIAKLQADILSAIHPLVKPGGTLVYSTCTTEPEENAEQIRRFLAEHPEFEPDPNLEELLPGDIVARTRIEPGMIQLLPHLYDSDGFFIARLIKRA